MLKISPQSVLRVSKRLVQSAASPNPWHKPTGFETGIHVYNSQTRRTQPLTLRSEHIATWYTCGPTVYDSTHLGHASCYVKLDILQRVLREFFGIPLVTAMNITDIDDKIIRRALEEGRPWQEIAAFYEQEFWGVLERLGVQQPDVRVRVTENVPQIVGFIQKLIDKGLAYVGKDNSVYFKLDAYPNYGKLQKLSSAHAVSDQVKLSNVDFALWKAKKTPSEPSWPSPWSDGRPGWHIECSVLASMLFGDRIDFHAGGLDLRFPHHENEEAQSCAFHDSPQWVNYWLHAGQLHVKGQAEKMSKSLKNTISVDNMLDKFSPEAFRMACVLSNYRNAMEYSDELMDTARNTLSKFIAFRSDCQSYLEGKKRCSDLTRSEDFLAKLSESKKSVESALKDDFDTAKCVKILTDLTATVSRTINTEQTSDDLNYSASLVNAVGAVDKFTSRMMDTFGFGQIGAKAGSFDANGVIDDIVQLRRSVRDRAVAAKSKEMFQICDDIRQRLSCKGIEVKDHKTGSSWNFKV